MALRVLDASEYELLTLKPYIYLKNWEKHRKLKIT